MSFAEVQPIFWGTSWSNYQGDILTGIDTLYAGLTAPNGDYLNVASQYAGTNGSYSSTYNGYHQHVLNTSASSDNIQSVASMICGLYPNANIYYAVYTDVAWGFGNNQPGACAFHNYGTCPSGSQFGFGFFYSNLTSNATNAGNTYQCYGSNALAGQSGELAALADVSAHELTEAITDPLLNAWYYVDTGGEIGDLCDFDFGPFPVTLSNGSQWRLQGEWSNAAANAHNGFAVVGNRGCIDTQTPGREWALINVLTGK